MVVRSKGVLGCIVCMVEAVSIRLDVKWIDVGIIVSGVLYEVSVRVCPSGEFLDFAIIMG